jgi:hypothetical protein
MRIEADGGMAWALSAGGPSGDDVGLGLLVDQADDAVLLTGLAVGEVNYGEIRLSARGSYYFLARLIKP